MIDSWESSGKNSHRKHKFKEVFQKVTTTRVKNARVFRGPQTCCYKSVHKLSASCVRTSCSYVVATSLEEAVSNL